MTTVQPDTPETVAAKLADARTIALMFAHYIAENHPGDWDDCHICQERQRDR